MDYWTRLLNVLIFYTAFLGMCIIMFLRAGVSPFYVLDFPVYIVPTIAAIYLYILGEVITWIREED